MKKQRVLAALAGVVFVSLALIFLKGGADEDVSLSSDRAASAATNGQNRVFAPGENFPSSAVAAVAPAVSTVLSARGTKTFRIAADRTITEPLRRTLADLGARVLAPVGARAVLVEATPAVAKRIAKDVRFTAEDVVPAAKIQKGLAQMCAACPRDRVKVSILALSGADREALIASVTAEGGKILHSPLGPESLAAELPSSLVVSLAERGDVRWIERAPEHCLLNDKTVVEAGANVDRLRTLHLLKGRGQKVTICDSGLDKGLLNDVHLDVSGRVREIVHIGTAKASESGFTATLADYNGHGTHVAGTVLGDGARSDGLYKGMAPAAELYFQAASDTDGAGVWIDNYEALLSRSVANGVYIHSDSWGSSYGRSVYDAVNNTFDNYLWKNPDLLVVVAAGNAGNEDSGDHTIASYPACAKNVLTVGNTMSTRPTDKWLLPGNPENLNPSSSRGPTADGRIKPEVAAPGTAVYSTLSSKSLARAPIAGNEYYTELTGTSMATPLVSGTAALVREWLVERRGMTERPTAALMKAILSGGGVQMTGKGAKPDGDNWTQFNLPQELPNADYGWGRVNLEETLYPTNGRAIKFVDRIPFADQQEWTLDITTTNAAPLDIQLCWIDYPADASTDEGRTLINDLDLVVSNKTSGAVWCGNGIAGGDHTNTTESVRIAAADAPAGDYAVIVRGYAVAYDSTLGGAAAVYVRGAFEDETAPDPFYIRNVRSGAKYIFLDEALREVQSGDTLEILHPTELAASVTLAVPCTIVSTNADPLASRVTRTDGAAIRLASGAALTLTNVVFAADDTSVAVTASAGARLILSGSVGLGTAAVADADTICFAAPLVFVGDRLSVTAPTAFEIGHAFGSWTGDFPSASNAAALVINTLNDELGGVAEDGTGRLVWGVIPCDPSIAKCVVDGDGISTTYCRTFSQALQIALQQDSTVKIKKPAEMKLPVTMAHNLILAGDGGSLAFATNAPTAGFVIPQGTALTVSNLLVSGAGVKLADCAFKVMGGELTLESGATLRSFSNAYQYQGKPWGGTIVVTAGTVTMNSGARIENCAAHEAAAGGGAIYLGGKAATANLFGGVITGCSAPQGGAVYAWGNSTTGAWVNIKGDFTARGNTNSGRSRSSNVFLAHRASLAVPDYLLPVESKRTIGLSFGKLGGEPDKNAEGQPFTICNPGSLPASGGMSGEDTAQHFFSDTDAELQGQYVDDSGCYCFQWEKILVEPQTAPFPGAKVWIKKSASVTYYYPNLDEALADLSWAATSYVFNVMDDIQLMRDVEISKKVVIQRDESLSLNPTVYRKADAMYKVVPGGSLVLSNINVLGVAGFDPISGYWTDSQVGLFSVKGGSLTLASGASVGAVYGETSRAANAITVYGGGTLTMESGSMVVQSQNYYENPSDATGVGGAILLDNATAFFLGGEVVYSAAARAGGVYVANRSKAYISGDFVATNNTDLSFVTMDNVIVSKNSELILDGPFTGAVGVNEGLACDTNWFGTVSKDWAWDIDTLTNSAARFVHDKRNTVGVAVTNGMGEAVLVWSDWLSRAGAFEQDGLGPYRIFIDPGRVIATPGTFSVAPKLTGDGRTVLSLDGGVEGCWYTVYATTDLSKPFMAEKTIQLKAGETFEYEIDSSAAAKFYKVIAEEGIK